MRKIPSTRVQGRPPRFAALDPRPEIWLVVPPPLYGEGYGMNGTVINKILPSIIPALAARLEAVTGVVDVFSALGGAGLEAPELFCG